MDKFYNNYPVVLLIAFLTRLSIKESVSFPDAILGLGLVGLVLYREYRLEQKEHNKIIKDLEVFKSSISLTINDMEKKIQDLEQVKSHLLSLKTANQMTSMTARF